MTNQDKRRLLASRMYAIVTSPTFAISATALTMKKDGLDVLSLSAGEPDFDTPQHVKLAAINAINDGYTKYTPVSGSIELRSAIVDKLLRENNLKYTTSQVIVSNGAKQSIYNALLALINEGDEVIIPAPYWVSYPEMVLMIGGVPRIATCSACDSYKLTVKNLRSHINPKTKAIILNSPSNPTGMVYSEHELLEIAQVLLEYPDVHIISDDIYEHIMLDTKLKFCNIVNVEPRLLPRTIVVNGASKAYSMTGWRIGFAACTNNEIITAMDTAQSQSTSGPCSISQAAACSAFNGGLESVLTMRDEFIRRYEYVFKRLNAIATIKCLRAHGAFYAFF